MRANIEVQNIRTSEKLNPAILLFYSPWKKVGN
jgi:hypothetical protein